MKPLFDVWGAMGLTVIARNLPARRGVENLYEQGYTGVRYMIKLHEMKSNRWQHQKHGPGDITHAEAKTIAEDLGLEFLLCIDWHVTATGPDDYHGPPGPKSDRKNHLGWAPWIFDTRDGWNYAEEKVAEACEYFRPDIVQVANEPASFNDWDKSDPPTPEVGEAWYSSGLNIYFRGMVMADYFVPVLAGPQKDWIKMRGALSHEDYSPWKRKGMRIYSKHDFVFPKQTDPDRLEDAVKDRNRDVNRSTPIPVWQDEGSGVGKKRNTPNGKTITDSSLGADLTEAYLRGCWSEDVVPGLLQVNGAGPVCGEAWGNCMNLVHPDGKLTKSAIRIIELQGGDVDPDPDPVDPDPDPDPGGGKNARQHVRTAGRQCGKAIEEPGKPDKVLVRKARAHLNKALKKMRD